MQFSNPKLPEGINAEDDSGIKEALLLGAIVAGAVGLFLWLVFLLAELLAPLVPFSWEQHLKHLPTSLARDSGADKGDSKILREIGARTAANMKLPRGMAVEFHLAGGKLLGRNAFAAPAGQIFVGRDLLHAMPNENALSFVLAHEIAHVRERHVARAMGRKLLFSVFAIAVLGRDSNFDRLLGISDLLSTYRYSRDLEDAADRLALTALQRQYGHGGGFEEAFAVLAKFAGARSKTPEFLKTHPDLNDRISRLKNIASEKAIAINGKRSPLRFR